MYPRTYALMAFFVAPLEMPIPCRIRGRPLPWNSGVSHLGIVGFRTSAKLGVVEEACEGGGVARHDEEGDTRAPLTCVLSTPFKTQNTETRAPQTAPKHENTKTQPSAHPQKHENTKTHARNLKNLVLPSKTRARLLYSSWTRPAQ